ncbi:DivIVA domain-containing protein [Streptomyces sp. BA2]|uniref:DivIVA domain-containing protein n=1 Tax=Streptomyces sp. BA2 TaxID=436595 RepID=UPI00136944E4|nr:DivIVA domain-containing protein [Streptomyces sp. BA2]
MTPNDIRQRKFTTVLFRQGYDEKEVDAFLDDVEVEVSRLRRRVEELEFELVVTRQRDLNGYDDPQLNSPTVPPRSFHEDAAGQGETPSTEDCCSVGVLRLAQQTADQAIAEARADANRIIAEAEGLADRLRQEAHASAYAMERKASALRGFERDCRSRLKTYLQSQLHQLDYYESSEATPSWPRPAEARESMAWSGPFA